MYHQPSDHILYLGPMVRRPRHQHVRGSASGGVKMVSSTALGCREEGRGEEGNGCAACQRGGRMRAASSLRHRLEQEQRRSNSVVPRHICVSRPAGGGMPCPPPPAHTPLRACRPPLQDCMRLCSS
ncbi:hypothetical protein LY76DRAFT_371625 [Colletotrichum caudatum]|nr:hypothetical protein LY76DRAFT_371625 [Colletotrichum caudatum]